jgi:hypothetical protein
MAKAKAERKMAEEKKTFFDYYFCKLSAPYCKSYHGFFI